MLSGVAIGPVTSLLPEGAPGAVSSHVLADVEFEPILELLGRHQLTHVQTGKGRDGSAWRWRRFW